MQCETCETKPVSRGLCSKHYFILYRGDGFVKIKRTPKILKDKQHKTPCRFCKVMTTSKQSCCRNCYMKYLRNDHEREKRRLTRVLCEKFLGGECKSCGTNSRLEIDHINKESKSYTIAHRLARGFEYLKPELEKCQLLCKICHHKKTSAENIKHGPTRYRAGCRCCVCKAAQSIRNKRRIRDKNGRYLGWKAL